MIPVASFRVLLTWWWVGAESWGARPKVFRVKRALTPKNLSRTNTSARGGPQIGYLVRIGQRGKLIGASLGGSRIQELRRELPQRFLMSDAEDQSILLGREFFPPRAAIQLCQQGARIRRVHP